ncbi:hypothetical protein BC939DRAFT_501023 [Gamsiella multidivaricata]|uniref:uncharacterized protein n=1 Tax=Gamsiella multidivaricata TaxID=101098 RepID=UPI00221EB4A2|nr:uncharacterized protein BC939DRAFT_501023 [Gamsiella multidivaricata]KAG0361187.1 hypothetical protein BGZ54_009203 [Gamsiella multidivaricata]KAI7828043.1 hypothetical protein BC939DRAFT_501023 [Gamsiella multidivaricata]
MSRIPGHQSIQWLVSSFGTGTCRNSSSLNTLTRNRINKINKISSTNSPDYTYSHSCLFFSTSARPNAKKKTIDAATLDSISQALINDLYTQPSSSRAKVTLDDVLALKPARNAITADEFNKLKDLVAASFNVSQLKSVLRSQKMPANGKKSVLVNQIMILMDLDVKALKAKLPVVEDPYTPAEPIALQKVFPSSRRELFFILGSEGDSLREVEREKNVRISINIANETYIIRGARDSIEDAQNRIRELVAVTEEAWDISAYADRDLVTKEPSVLEDIARRSQTFVSVGDQNTLNIACRSSKDMDEAKRLFDLRLHKLTHGVENLTLLHQEDELKPLGMFPVYDSVSMTADESQKSFFRIAQTEPYADKTVDNPTILPIQSALSHVGTLEELKRHLKSSIDEVHTPHQTFDLSANFGQVLFHNKNHAMTQLPLSGPFDAFELEGWLKKAEEPYFLQSLPFFKAVSRLPLVGLKTKTIEVEYIPSSSSSVQNPVLDPIRVIFMLDNEGELCVQDGKAINRQWLANLMMLGQPTDIQIRSELATRIDAKSPVLNELLSQTALSFANRLQCPNFYSFRNLSSETAAAQLGLSTGPTHTLKTVLFKTTGIFDYHGLPLVASDIVNQHGRIRKQELKLLPLPLEARPEPSESDIASELTSTSSSLSTLSLENWDDFTKAALHLSRTL